MATAWFLGTMELNFTSIQQQASSLRHNGSMTRRDLCTMRELHLCAASNATVNAVHPIRALSVVPDIIVTAAQHPLRVSVSTSSVQLARLTPFLRGHNFCF